LEHLVESGLATRYTVLAEMPTVSRVMYETIHTGTPPNRHGITSNSVVRRSSMPNLFELASRQGLRTAAAAYCWYSELYNRSPFDVVDDREVDDPALAIQHGRFYYSEEYPDADLFATAASLVRKFAPDYLLVHPMGMDHTGHLYGAESSEYRNHAVVQDQILGTCLPEWLERGYTVLIMSDHGLNRDKWHGGSLPDVRNVPLYFMRPDAPGQGDTRQTVSQLRIAPTICRLLGLTIPESMREAPLPIEGIPEIISR
jgi:predicted AlkP superfamily pyrophosphatase or phosphodiesterase